MTNHMFATIRGRIRASDRTFIAVPPAEGVPGRAIRYDEAIATSGRMANALIAHGVCPGDRVAVQVEKSAEAILLYLACLRAGAVYLPLNTAYTLAELEYFLGDAEPRMMIAAPERVADIAPLASRLGIAATHTLGTDGQSGTFLEAAHACGTAFADVARGADDLAAILYTSGTTGRSKGAMLSHGNLASNALTLVEAWRFTADDVLLHALPIFHTHGLFVATNVTLMAGASMVFMPRFDAQEVMRLLPGATVMMGVPTYYVRLLQEAGLNRASTSHMRLFVSGSAPLLTNTHVGWVERTGHAILERYGMTETNMNTSNPYEGRRVAGTVGPPLPGVEIRVTDKDGTPLPDGEVGMVEIRGPHVFKGYWRLPDVYAKEVETEIDALPHVVESAVIGVLHPDLGEGVTAIVVRQDGSDLDERAILVALEGRLARYKLPRRVLFADDLPRNAMGKVQKNTLRDAYRDIYTVL